MVLEDSFCYRLDEAEAEKWFYGVLNKCNQEELVWFCESTVRTLPLLMVARWPRSLLGLRGYVLLAGRAALLHASAATASGNRLLHEKL